MENHWINSNTDALIYIGDAMCSWCHGMSPELDKLKANHPELEFKVVNGGLRPHGTETNETMADFLRSHWVEIAERTGQPFKYDILDDPNFVYDTEPASRAAVVARMLDPEIEFDFFKAIQMAFYADNKDINKTETFVDLAVAFGFDKSQFEKLFNSDEAKYQTKQDFALSQQMGIKGFPSIVLRKDGKYTLIANGYREAEMIEETLSQVNQMAK